MPSKDTARRVADALQPYVSRLDALERGIMGTPERPGIAGKLDTMKVDVDHRFDKIGSMLRVNNWLTGLVIAILISAGIKILVGG